MESAPDGSTAALITLHADNASYELPVYPPCQAALSVKQRSGFLLPAGISPSDQEEGSSLYGHQVCGSTFTLCECKS